jgi:hypothetical protein
MKKIRLLHIEFDTEIRATEVPAFRSAIIEKVGRENILFHNHLNDEQYLYKYPLIQYKQIRRHPCILCIDYGVDEIHKYFENRNWNIKINDRWLEMKIARLNLNQFTMQVWNKMFDYHIRNWIALNQENYLKYFSIEGMVDKIQFLEKTLTANILSFAKGIEWTVEKPVEVKILEIVSSRRVMLKNKQIVGFTVNFRTNVFLPNFIGLGKAVSKGFGIVNRLKDEE